MKIKGKHISIDACSICQLHCPRCPQKTMDYILRFGSIIGKGYLKFDDFKDILLNSPEVRSAAFDNAGELFLNPEFLKIIRPDTAIYMTGTDNKYGHPHREILDILASFGAKIFRTDEIGAITMKSDGEKYKFSLPK
jgi:hypothetical protein